MERITVLGTGAMGSRMARRLLDAGHEVAVYNRNAERTKELLTAGARVADTPRLAAEGADVVVSMVTDDDAARSVWLAEGTGALAGVRPGATVVESSTVTPSWSEELSTRAHERGVEFLEAPVAGSRPQAEAGVLIYFVGGASETLERRRAVLERMGGAIHHVGVPGNAARIKLAVNALFAVQAAALGELLGALEKSGLGRDAAMGVLAQVPVTSPAAAGLGRAMVADAHAPMFPVDLVHKDLRYAALMAAQNGATLPTLSAVQHAFERARDAGLGNENISAVARLYT